MNRHKIFYSFIRKVLPVTLKALVTRSLYLIDYKPTVNKKAISPLKKAVVVLSADFEMAWAYRFSKAINDATEMGLKERENIPRIIELLERFKIPVTWATVGHLFLEKCKKNNGVAHSDMPRPGFFENRNWLYNRNDWYDNDPCSDHQKDPAWYAPDLIENILNSSLKHELGCHTFSHIDCTYDNCPYDLAKAEIKACLDLAKKYDRNLVSMVFPGGTYGNFEVLREAGFICYRQKMQFDIDLPRIDEFGLVAIPSSYGMDRSNYNWSAKTMREMAFTYVDKAIKYKLVCHFWFHPAMDKWYLEEVFPDVLKYLDKKRHQDVIEILTMEQLAGKFL